MLRAANKAFSFVGNPRNGISSNRAYNSLRTPLANLPLPPRPPRSTALAGTVPRHTSYLFLHAQIPPSAWPSVFISHLYMEAQRLMKENGGLVNFCWQGEQSPRAGASDASGEAYSATLWRNSETEVLSGRSDIPFITSKNLGVVIEHSFRRLLDSQHAEDVASSGPYFYICTHGRRDCRCGVRGSELVRDFMKELDVRGMLFDRNGKSRVAEVGHVGGHKNAPNLLVFPYGDWYGNLESRDIPGLVEHYIRSLEERPIPPSILSGPNRFQWRGRMGMTKEEQTKAFYGQEWGVTDLLGYSGLL